MWLLLVTAASPLAAQSPPGPSAELQAALERVQLDEPFSFRVTDLRLRREAVRLTLTHGTLIFLEEVEGKVTGAVFEGAGQALVMPPTTVERKQLAMFTGSPLLSANFSSAYFRFTDDTFLELLAGIRDGHGRAHHDPDAVSRWQPHLEGFNRAHSPRLLMDLLEPETGSYFFARIQSRELGWFDMVVDSRRDESVMVGQVVTVEGRPHYNIWTSFAPEDIEALPPPARGRRYEIQTTINPDMSLEGNTRVDLEFLQSGPRLLRFQLSRYINVTSVRQDGEAIEFFQNAGLQGDEVVNRGNDQVLVVLTRPHPAGSTVRLEFSYRGNVITTLGDGIFFVGARGQWYPSIYDNRPVPFTMTFRYPQQLTLVAAGEQTASRSDGFWQEESWQAEVPVTLAGFNLGSYQTRTLDTEDYHIEVFANKALESHLARKYSTPPAAGGTAAGDASRGNPSYLLDQIATDVADVLEFFSEIFAPYPRRHLHVTQIPAAFGQGFPGLIYLPTYTFLAPAAQQRLGLSDSARRFYSDLMPAHETAHQWWGTWLPPETYRDAWLSEALATYSGLIYFERRRDAAGMGRTWLRQFRDDMLRPNPQGDPLEQAGPLELGPRLDSSAHPGGSLQLIYTKGPWVIHMLRELLRDPKTGSDRIFLDGLRELTQRPEGEPLNIRQFREAFEKRLPVWADLDSNHNLEWFFDQWVSDVGIPRYELDWDIREEDGTPVAAGRIRQKEVPGLFLMPVPIYARYGSRLELLERIVVTGEQTAFNLPLQERPDEILLDPYDTVLKLPEPD